MLVVNLFSGVGGFHIGFEQAGCKIGLAIDPDEKIEKIHKFNFPHVPFINANIMDITSDHINDVLDQKEIDILLGSLPINGFTPLKDSKPSVKFKMIDNDIVNAYLRLVRELQPKNIIIELLKGLRDEELYNLIEELEQLDYKIFSKVFDMADFGVPQRRERDYIIGNREGQSIKLPLPSHSKYGDSGLKEWVDCWKVISDLEIIKKDESINHIPLNSKNIAAYLKDLPEDEDLSNYLLNSKRRPHYQKFKRLKYDQPSFTLTYQLPIHPILQRTLTIREAARIQTIPDNIILFGSKYEQSRYVSRAVPPLFAMKLAKHILEQLNESNKDDFLLDGEILAKEEKTNSIKEVPKENIIEQKVIVRNEKDANKYYRFLVKNY